MEASPRDGGVLCFGVGCWGMKGAPAVLRLMIGWSLPVSESSNFLDFDAGINCWAAESRLAVAGGTVCAPFVETAS